MLSREYGSLPGNCIAQIYARQNDTSVLRMLTKTERQALPLPSLRIERPNRVNRVMQKTLKSFRKNTIKTLVEYDSTNRFIAAHIKEVNKCYTCGSYTAAFILCRKIIENLLVDIIRTKYPERESIPLYFDPSRSRTKDISEIILNLRKRAADFGVDKVLVERICSTSQRFKEDANDKTHSWYHLSSKSELEGTEVQRILDMLKELQDKVNRDNK